MDVDRPGEKEPDSRRVLKLTLEYDGTAFAGWQRQADVRTVQEVLEVATGDYLGERVAVVAAGRTDAGVHATGQVASFRTASSVPARGVLHGVNALLPADVAIVRAEDAPADFHARRSARGKHYRYRILNRRAPAPVAGRFATLVPTPLDAERMARAARCLLGTHDFLSFRNAGSVEGPTVRTVGRLDIGRSGDYISIDIEGDGFLYRMVRNIAGTLLLAGRGKIGAGDVEDMLARRDRRFAGPSAPARGLTLVEVFY